MKAVDFLEGSADLIEDTSPAAFGFDLKSGDLTPKYDPGAEDKTSLVIGLSL